MLKEVIKYQKYSKSKGRVNSRDPGDWSGGPVGGEKRTKTSVFFSARASFPAATGVGRFCEDLDLKSTCCNGQPAGHSS